MTRRLTTRTALLVAVLTAFSMVSSAQAATGSIGEGPAPATSVAMADAAIARLAEPLAAPDLRPEGSDRALSGSMTQSRRLPPHAQQKSDHRTKFVIIGIIAAAAAIWLAYQLHRGPGVVVTGI